uniref:Carnosine synthase 1 n=1 Tax=Pipistrellus kuhlii TaxID=59472 RepID=A0A7J7RZG4_PIPKU|nr:carnosine synthase 1 [Pipistrellus kuhlii]
MGVGVGGGSVVQPAAPSRPPPPGDTARTVCKAFPPTPPGLHSPVHPPPLLVLGRVCLDGAQGEVPFVPRAHPAPHPPLSPLRPQLSADQPSPQRDCPPGSEGLEDEEGPRDAGSGLPPADSFPGAWRLDVGLDCPGCPEGAEARARTAYHYSLLQSCLQLAGLPETQDRSQAPRTGCPGAEVTLCVLGSPSTFLSVLLEGGTQSPGNMLLCLSPTWLAKAPAPGRPGEAALLVSKAVSFHPGGLSFLDAFVPPRQATYFLAGLGPGPGQGGAAAELARDLTCPTGASAELARLLEDRLLARQLLAQRGVAVPATLAFACQPPALLRAGAVGPGLRLVQLSRREGQEALVKAEVRAFLHSEALGDARQVTAPATGWHQVPLGSSPLCVLWPPPPSFPQGSEGVAPPPAAPPPPRGCRWPWGSAAGAGGAGSRSACTREPRRARWRTPWWRCWRGWRRRRVCWWRPCARPSGCPPQEPRQARRWPSGSAPWCAGRRVTGPC